MHRIKFTPDLAIKLIRLASTVFPAPDDMIRIDGALATPQRSNPIDEFLII